MAAVEHVAAQVSAMCDIVTSLMSVVAARRERVAQCDHRAAADLAALQREHGDCLLREEVKLSDARRSVLALDANLADAAHLAGDDEWRQYYERRVSAATWWASASGVCAKVRTLSDHIDALQGWAERVRRLFDETHARRTALHATLQETTGALQRARADVDDATA
jgi:hypothetical protein